MLESAWWNFQIYEIPGDIVCHFDQEILLGSIISHSITGVTTTYTVVISVSVDCLVQFDAGTSAGILMTKSWGCAFY